MAGKNVTERLLTKAGSYSPPLVNKFSTLLRPRLQDFFLSHTEEQHVALAGDYSANIRNSLAGMSVVIDCSLHPSG